MAQDTLPDLNQIQLQEAFFLECLISNVESGVVVLPDQVAGYERPQVKILPMVDLEKQRVSFDIRVQATALDEQGTLLPVTGRFRLLLSFSVANLPDLLYTDERFNQQIPNAQLTVSLISVAYSTARGMIMSKVNDTVMGGLALPLQSGLQLMQESQPTTEEIKALRARQIELAEKAKNQPKKTKQAASKK
jgi:hypothetical protein